MGHWLTRQKDRLLKWIAPLDMARGVRQPIGIKLASHFLTISYTLSAIAFIVFYIDKDALASYPYYFSFHKWIVLPDVIYGICIASIILTNMRLLVALIIRRRIGWKYIVRACDSAPSKVTLGRRILVYTSFFLTGIQYSIACIAKTLPIPALVTVFFTALYFRHPSSQHFLPELVANAICLALYPVLYARVAVAVFVIATIYFDIDEERLKTTKV